MSSVDDLSSPYWKKPSDVKLIVLEFPSWQLSTILWILLELNFGYLVRFPGRVNMLGWSRCITLPFLLADLDTFLSVSRCSWLIVVGRNVQLSHWLELEAHNILYFPDPIYILPLFCMFIPFLIFGSNLLEKRLPFQNSMRPGPTTIENSVTLIPYQIRWFTFCYSCRQTSTPSQFI